MKFGFRKPSLLRSIKASTSASLNRAIKKAIIPGYGEKGMGLANPKKAAYNALYNMTTASMVDVITNTSKPKVSTRIAHDKSYVTHPLVDSKITSNSSCSEVYIINHLDDETMCRRLQELSKTIRCGSNIRLVNSVIKVLNFSTEYYTKRIKTNLHLYITKRIEEKANDAKREFLKTEYAICKYMIDQLQTERSIEDICNELMNLHDSMNAKTK